MSVLFLWPNVSEGGSVGSMLDSRVNEHRFEPCHHLKLVANAIPSGDLRSQKMVLPIISHPKNLGM